MNTRRRASSGFALLGVVILVALIATLSTTWMRHVYFDNQASAASRTSIEANAAADSGLQFGQQSLSVGDPPGAWIVSNGPRDASVQTSELAGDHGGILVTATDDYGLGATLLAETARRAVAITTDPDAMPRLDDATVDALLTDPTVAKLYYSGMQWIQDTTLSGIVVVQNYSAVYFDNVTLRGCIVSEDVLTHGGFGSYDPSSAPSALVDGTLRIEPADFLPGVAVLMPDGIFTDWSSTSSLQIEGDVVAHTVDLQCQGSLLGNVASVSPLSLNPSIEQPGQGRTPRPWATSLDMGGSWDTDYVAILPKISTVADLPGVTAFTFP